MLGVRYIVSKSGQDCLNTFKHILCDIEDVSRGSDEVAWKILVKISSTMSDRASTQILVKISSTISDRASTQIKFNELLEEYRKDILPLTVENYDSMSEAQQLSLGKLCNFFVVYTPWSISQKLGHRLLWRPKMASLGEHPSIMDRSFMKAKEPGNNNKCYVYIAQFPFLAESASYKARHTSPKTGFTPRLPYKHLKVRS